MKHAKIPNAPFAWPEGKRVAVSLSFDDARPSQLANGLPVLDANGVKASFYVSFANFDNRVDEWRAALANGHEIGNHTFHHPCTGNFLFGRDNPLENYTLDKMEAELLEANAHIKAALGITPTTFAYPCGQKFVGRGVDTRSYVSVVAKHFLVGRSFRDESYASPDFFDLAQSPATDMDGASFEEMKNHIENAATHGDWVIFAGHHVGSANYQTVEPEMLDAVCKYALNPDNGVWIGTVAEIGTYINEWRHSHT